MYEDELYKKNHGMVRYSAMFPKMISLIYLQKSTKDGVGVTLEDDHSRLKSHFESKELAKFCEKYNTEHRSSSVYHPQFNGQVEVMNHILFKGIKKNMIQSGSKKSAWIDELPVILWSLRIIPSHARGETHFSLVYGSEAVLLTEVGLTYLLPNRV
ncbi:hypothetical protein LIER_34078 [Lithospermum erythrorhizon]|uniref:Integrase catalytic domain-containing protein n=1 Tax=Lithospermum erythrorhizon TaxID=34254 RepID=A0AAV3S0X6_LITER